MTLTKKTVPILFLLLLTGCITITYYRQLDNASARMSDEGTSFVVNATINDKPATLTVDTGTEFGLLLFRPAAERLGLTFSNVPMNPGGRSDGKIRIRPAGPYHVTAFNVTGKMGFGVVDLPTFPDTDGVIGWPLLKRTVLHIDASRQLLRTLEGLPQEAQGWTSLRLRHKSDFLLLEIPDSQGGGTILIDTGDPSGVSLSPNRWCEWTNAHPDRPKTLNAYYTPSAGAVIAEESWDERLPLGPLTLTQVPVTQADEGQFAVVGCDAILGITALQHLDLVIDGKKGVAYVRPRSGLSHPYSYNRAGAVFWPRSFAKVSETNLPIAHVLPGSPAYEANIRDGDEVLKVGQEWYTNWTVGPSTLCGTRPAGTRVDLTLKRGEETFSTTIVLRDIFPTNSILPTKQ